jgi:hypothetical protein
LRYLPLQHLDLDLDDSLLRFLHLLHLLDADSIALADFLDLLAERALFAAPLCRVGVDFLRLLERERFEIAVEVDQLLLGLE